MAEADACSDEDALTIWPPVAERPVHCFHELLVLPGETIDTAHRRCDSFEVLYRLSGRILNNFYTENNYSFHFRRLKYICLRFSSDEETAR